LREHRLSDKGGGILVRYSLTGPAVLLLMAIEEVTVYRQLTALFTDLAEFNAINTLHREVRAIFAFSCLDNPGYWDGGVLPNKFEGSRFIYNVLKGPFFASIDAVDVVEWPHGDGLGEGRLGERPYSLWLLGLTRHIALGLEGCCSRSRLAEAV
jgi:hypothetical protein